MGNVLNYINAVSLRFGIKIANLIFFAIIAKNLSVEDIATYGLFFYSSLMLAVLLDLGLRNSITKLVGDNKSYLNDSVKKIHILLCIIYILSAVAIYYVLSFASNSTLQLIVLPFILNVLFMSYNKTTQGFFLGLGQIDVYNKSEVASRLALILGIVYLLVFDVNLSTAAWVYTASQAACSLFLIIKVKSATISKSTSSNEEISSQLLSTVVLGGIGFMLASFAMNLSKRMHFYILEHFNIEQSGFFFGLFRTSEIMTEMALGISIVIFSKSANEKDAAKRLSGIAKVSRMSLLLIMPLFIFIFIFSNYLIEFLLGANYLAYSGAFYIILFATYLSVVWVIIFPSLSVCVSSITLFLCFLSAAALSSILYWSILAAGYNLTIYSASVVFLLSTLLVNLLMITIARSKCSLKFKDFILVNRQDIIQLSFVIGKIKEKLYRKV